MFDIVTLMNLACVQVEIDAKAEGRKATPDEYQAAMTRTWDTWLDASEARDMTVAGFVKTENGWRKPRRAMGFPALLVHLLLGAAWLGFASLWGR